MSAGSQPAPRAKTGTPLRMKRNRCPPSGSAPRSRTMVRSPTRSVTRSTVFPPASSVIVTSCRTGSPRSCVHHSSASGTVTVPCAWPFDTGRSTMVRMPDRRCELDPRGELGAGSELVGLHQHAHGRRAVGGDRLRPDVVPGEHGRLLHAQLDRPPDADRRHARPEIPAPRAHCLATQGGERLRLRHEAVGFRGRFVIGEELREQGGEPSLEARRPMRERSGHGAAGRSAAATRCGRGAAR